MWEIGISVLLSGIIFICFYLAINISDEKKYNYLRALFLFLGFVFIIPSLYAIKIIASEHSASVGRLVNIIFIGYLPIFLLLVWLIIITYLKDFFMDLIGNRKDDEDNYHG